MRMPTRMHARRRLPWMVWAATHVVMLLTLTGCVLMDALMDSMYGDRPNRLDMEPQVYALEGLNSAYDDFNAVAVPPPLRMDALIVFASNAATQGERFSIDMGRLQLNQDPYSSYRAKTRPGPVITATRHGPFALLPGDDANLRGPTALMSQAVEPRYYAGHFSHYEQSTLALMVEKEPLGWATGGVLAEGGVWMFDSDGAGRRNLYFVDEAGAVQSFFGNLPDADDAYATYDFDRHELIFSSNRSGQYQLYRYVNATQSTRFAEWLGDPALAAKIEPAVEFAGEGNRLAPFVEGDLLVFASDQPGGQGGYDLYASSYGEEGWDAPVNLQELMPPGVQVNTEADEFRPSLLTLRLDTYHELRVLVFSSNRPGGQGGYDLYLTALPDLRAARAAE